LNQILLRNVWTIALSAKWGRGSGVRTALRGQKLPEATDGTEDVPDIPAGDRNSLIDLGQDIKLLAVRGEEGGGYPTSTIPIRGTWYIFRAVTSGIL
jgi:hypothetical protein